MITWTRHWLPVNRCEQAKQKNWHGTTGWWNMSLITRFLLLAFTDHLVIFRCRTSLPLVSFTRFLLLATSSASFFIYARGLIYFTRYRTYGYGLLIFYFYSTAMLMLARRVFIGPIRSTWTMSISTSLCQDHSGWVRVCRLHQMGIVQMHEKLQCSRVAYSDGYPVTMLLVTPMTLVCNRFLTSSWALITPIHPSLFTSDPTFAYFISKKVPRFRLGGCGVHVLTEWFCFLLDSLQKRPSNFLFQIARGSGATPSGCTFFVKSAFHLDVLQEHFQISFRKLPGSTLFLLGRTWRNKKVFEFNHELLRGLSIQDL
jgi:hypothetical protein